MVDVATIMTTAVDPVAHCIAQAKLSSKASQSLDAPSSPSPQLSTTLAIDRFALSVAEGLRDPRAAVTCVRIAGATWHGAARHAK